MHGRPLGDGSTVAQRTEQVRVTGRHELDKLMSKLGTMPRILCWKCRKLTPFELDHCQHCGAAFAGATGGAYGPGRPASSRSVPGIRESSKPKSRTLSQIVDDLQRTNDHVDRPSRRPKGPRQDTDASLHLYQCPTCGRFVSEEATNCACGVRFAPNPLTFSCPECGSHVPVEGAACPVCGIEFGPMGADEMLIFSCPRCGSRVASDQSRCSCGVWFED